MLKALIFDVDGTLADTEMAHLAAFNHAFKAVGLDWEWSVPAYTELLGISGGKERMRHYWEGLAPDTQTLNAHFLQETIERIHRIKTAAYEQAVQDGQVQMRPGVLALIHEARQAGLQLAIATTTSPANISALLHKALGPDWTYYFTVVEDAATAPLKKPHPQVYRQTLERLQLPASACLAFEDSENGLRAALAAELPAIVTPNTFTLAHDFSAALRVLPSLEGVTLAQLQDLSASLAINA